MASSRNLHCYLLVRRNLFLSCQRLTCPVVYYVNSAKNNHCINRSIHTQSYVNQKAVKVSEKESEQGQVTLSTAEAVKENVKTTGYLTVILGGLAVTGFILYTIFGELFSGTSPNAIYTQAVEKCLNNTKVIDSLGEPIKSYGETNRRGRRRHVKNAVYLKDGVKHMRVQFYIEGTRKHGTVHCEVKENDHGKYEFRYLFVQLEDLLKTVIVVEDNRKTVDSNVLSPSNFNNFQLTPLDLNK